MATLKVVEQQWHIVCGSIEIEELTKNQKIKLWSAANDRHSLFLSIKYPDTKFYKGGWGPELLHYRNDGPHRGPVGFVYCTQLRLPHIQNWFLTESFEP